MSLVQLFVRTPPFAPNIPGEHHNPKRICLTHRTIAQYTIGAFLSAVSLNIVSQDVSENWRHAVLSQFALCGVAIVAWAFLPESARWHCMHDREAECKKILRKVNGGVKGYDIDLEYTRMLAEVRNQNVSASLQGGGSYLDVFRGTNRVRVC